MARVVHQWVKYSVLLTGCDNCLHMWVYVCRVHMTEEIHDRRPYAVQCHSNPQQGHQSVPSLFLMFYLRNVG